MGSLVGATDVAQEPRIVDGFDVEHGSIVSDKSPITCLLGGDPHSLPMPLASGKSVKSPGSVSHSHGSCIGEDLNRETR